MSRQKNTNKKFNKEVASFIIGESASIRLSGSPEKIRVTRDVLLASRNLYEELNRPDCTLGKVSNMLKEKHARAQIFEEVVGIPWKL